MGLFGSIGSFVSGSVSAIGSALGSVASSIGGFAKSCIQQIPIFRDMDIIKDIVTFVAKFFGALNPDDDIEELGAKANEAEKKPEDFDSTAEYIKYLRNEVKLDKEKFENFGKEEKMANQAVGIALASKAINEKMKTDISPEFLASVAKHDLNHKEVSSMIESFKDKNISLDKFSDYINKNKTDSSAKGALFESIKKFIQI